MSLNVKLKSPTGKTGERSVVLNPANLNCSIGGENDRWGFTASEFTNLDQWEIEISANNNYLANTGSSSIAMENATVTIYYDTFEETVVQCFIEDENLNAYGFFLHDLKTPEGLETETKFLNVDGTDVNEIYRQNIREKTIELEFSVDGCNIDETTKIFHELISLFVNERNELNKPIPKRIEFSNHPDVYWEYVLETAVDYEVSVASYIGKIKLTIPSGTAYTKEEIVTGKSGNIGGLAKINPFVTFIPLSDHIEINESLSNQKFIMSYNEWDSSCSVVVDCENRTVTLDKGDEDNLEDITAYTDFNTDWFLLHGDFIFEETNCVIQSVTWTERR